MRKGKPKLSRRSHAAQRMRQFRAKLTQEQLATLRQTNRERVKMKRALETPEQREQRHEQNRVASNNRRAQLKNRRRLERQNMILKRLSESANPSIVPENAESESHKNSAKKSDKPKQNNSKRKPNGNGGASPKPHKEHVIFLSTLALELIEENYVKDST